MEWVGLVFAIACFGYVCYYSGRIRGEIKGAARTATLSTSTGTNAAPASPTSTVAQRRGLVSTKLTLYLHDKRMWDLKADIEVAFVEQLSSTHCRVRGLSVQVSPPDPELRSQLVDTWVKKTNIVENATVQWFVPEALN